MVAILLADESRHIASENALIKCRRINSKNGERITNLCGANHAGLVATT
ncbi:hypothetical protein SpAn4DRAFT_3070 [Sporomusa ovata]|uniref:Uncharacterized protein n=1 Tax=Sporomusa ovata TaxID=2378 RepID=A0A0U1KYW6_9FIRM|nr:hypothetical protein SpAn4DRAFT_3070 [Sporomusa ovata]